MLPKVLSTPLEMVPPTAARLGKGAEGHIRLIAKRETIKSWREIVTAKHETTVSWHATKINMMKSKIENNRASTRSSGMVSQATRVDATMDADGGARCGEWVEMG